MKCKEVHHLGKMGYVTGVMRGKENNIRESFPIGAYIIFYITVALLGKYTVPHRTTNETSTTLACMAGH